VFAPVGTAAVSAEDEDVLYCTVGGISGRGLYTSEGFVVLRGSVGRREDVPTFSEANQRFRQRLVDGGVMKNKGDTVVFVKDHVFGSPSMTAIALLGRSSTLAENSVAACDSDIAKRRGTLSTEIVGNVAVFHRHDPSDGALRSGRLALPFRVGRL
jgi:hypothetical protein